MNLRNAIKAKDIEQIRQITKEKPVADIAIMIDKLTSQERVLFFRFLETESQSEIFAQLDQKTQEDLVHSFTDKQINDIIGDLYSDDIAMLVEDVPIELQRRIMLSIRDKQTRDRVNYILKYSTNQIGSIMNMDIVKLDASSSIGEAINKIKKHKDDARLTHHFFVVDSKEQLKGSISLEDLFFSDKTKRLKDILTPIASLLVTSNKEKAAQLFAVHDKSVLPVVDKNNVLLGIVTADDIIDIFEEAATDDAHKMAGIIEAGEPYSTSSTWSLFKSRVIWLMLLMISATISQIVLDSFQGFAQRALDSRGTVGVSSIIWTTAIVAILPVISGAAGNAGSQSSTMVIRSLATGDISPKEYVKVFWKELKVSNLIGLTLGIANFIRLVIYYAASGSLSEEYIFLSLAASVALFVVIILAKIVGGLLPLAAKSLKLDPAVMAAPLLTTLIDALSTMIFFGVSIGIMVLVI